MSIDPSKRLRDSLYNLLVDLGKDYETSARAAFLSLHFKNADVKLEDGSRTSDFERKFLASQGIESVVRGNFPKMVLDMTPNYTINSAAHLLMYYDYGTGEESLDADYDLVAHLRKGTPNPLRTDHPRIAPRMPGAWLDQGGNIRKGGKGSPLKPLSEKGYQALLRAVGGDVSPGMWHSKSTRATVNIVKSELRKYVSKSISFLGKISPKVTW
jgi:hypothetical protein